jgi:hypothetical protein
MKTKQPFILISCLFASYFLTACDNKKSSAPVEASQASIDTSWSKLPKVIRLDSLKQTEFAATLEEPISGKKNIIYAPSLLFAFDKLKEALGSPIELSGKSSSQLQSIINSKSYKNSLNHSEYQVSSEVAGDEIRIEAFFNKTLPFETKMDGHKQPIRFKDHDVAAFGMYDYDHRIAALIDVLYYKNDDHFIIRLNPVDKNHDIYLWKNENKFKSLADGLKQFNNKLIIGSEESKKPGNDWKYTLQETDSIAIPQIRFNLETNYKKLEGQQISTSDQPQLKLEFVYQRTGFILNENGAVVESYAEFSTTEDRGDAELPRPKKMIFDKPFFIVLKKKDSPNPYFVMKVENAELLEKFRK